MSKKKISKEDIRLIRPISEIVELHNEYLEQGFSAEEMAAVFADIFVREFEKKLTPEAAVKISTGSLYHKPFSNHEAAISYCLSLGIKLVNAVNLFLEKDRLQKDKTT